MPKSPRDTDDEQEYATEESNQAINEAAIDAVVPKAAKYEGSFGPKVKIKITKFGHGSVSAGEHIPGHGDKMAPAGSILEVDKSVADALEAKGFAEIQ